ncbi:MAG: DUF1648 domain-containing protein [Fibrobacter sp.]|nr:DUF1648 domain-containing protein [Fibrobacter sp.]
MKKRAVLYAVFFIHIGMSFVILPFLPDKVPFHWNWKGEIDQWVPRVYLAWMSLIPVILYAFLWFVVPRIDPKKESWKIHSRAYSIVIVAVSCMFIPLQWLIASISLGFSIRMDIVVRIFVGAIFLVSGNYMGKIRHNYFCGIRTPWTLANESVWRKTHRHGAIVFVIMGLLMIAGVCIPHQLTSVLVSLSGLAGIPYIIAYSWFLYKKSAGDEITQRVSGER